MTLERTAQRGIYKRGTKYVAIVSYKDRGVSKQRWITRGGLRAAQSARRDFLNDLDKGVRPDGEKMTVEGLFAEWLAEVEATKRALTTDKYARTARLHILPAIGHMQLKEVDRNVLRDLYRSLPSPVMARYCHSTLSAAFGWAVKDRGLLGANPCAAVRPPKVQHVEAKHLELDEAKRMLEVTKGHPLEAAIILGLVGGLRIAEAVSVTWEDVDLETGSLLVRGSFHGPTKSGKPRGLTVPGPQVAALRACKARQARDLLRLGIRQTERTPILAGHLGDMRAPKRLWRGLQSLLRSTRVRRDVPRLAPLGRDPHVAFGDGRHDRCVEARPCEPGALVLDLRPLRRVGRQDGGRPIGGDPKWLVRRISPTT
jgi:integrase